MDIIVDVLIDVLLDILLDCIGGYIVGCINGYTIKPLDSKNVALYSRVLEMVEFYHLDIVNGSLYVFLIILFLCGFQK